MKEFTAIMPVKVKGKIVPTGEVFECDADEAKALARDGVLAPGSSVELDEGDFDLGEALAKLISEGKDIAEMNMEDINALLPKRVKRKQVDEALKNIKVGE